MRIELPPFCGLLPVLPLSLSAVLLRAVVFPAPFAAEPLYEVSSEEVKRKRSWLCWAQMLWAGWKKLWSERKKRGFA
jgi:hypothetical protein